MTYLPESLKKAITEEVQRFSQTELATAREDLSTRYRDRSSKIPKRFIATNAHRGAYVVSRLPATWAVVRRVLMELKIRAPELNFESFLDIGAGPGTASWAAIEVFSSLSNAVLLEQDIDMIAIGQRLAKHSENAFLKNAMWQKEDILNVQKFPQCDLIVVSYAIGEIPDSALVGLVEKCWQATTKAIVFIEPGTPHGFERIRRVRSELIRIGAHLAAPCPHMLACPMPKEDWCHFTERIERSALHRLTKNATLGYEDEKYSYVIGIKEQIKVPNARILRHPLKHKGHLSFTLCTEEVIKEKIVSKRDGDFYKQAKKLEWGDVL
jgi:ribosomal protein RSM22 (predicted rRNA methylase)